MPPGKLRAHRLNALLLGSGSLATVLFVATYHSSAAKLLQSNIFEFSKAPLNLCENGKIDPGESCDQGGGIWAGDGDGCNAQCQVEEGWACTNPSGPMDASECAPVCGDGIKINNTLFLEECDDGNLASGDGCSGDCKLEICGDGKVIGNEQCDDGKICVDTEDNELISCTSNEDCPELGSCEAFGGDGCSATCTIEPGWHCPNSTGKCKTICGDGITVPSVGETCDNGMHCQDGAECTEEEFCSDGSQCMPRSNDGCNYNCEIEFCGDGIKNNVNELCDDGRTCVDGTSCLSNADCEGKGQGPGDGLSLFVDEFCEMRNNDSCPNNCGVICGDGTVTTPPEQCDVGGVCADGKTVCVIDLENGKGSACKAIGMGLCTPGAMYTGCTSQCQVAFGWACNNNPAESSQSTCGTTCGDGIVAGTEACDTGLSCQNGKFCSDEDACADGSVCMLRDGDGCNVTCQVETGWICDDENCFKLCGNGEMDFGEECDDGNTNDFDNCLNNCTLSMSECRSALLPADLFNTGVTNSKSVLVDESCKNDAHWKGKVVRFVKEGEIGPDGGAVIWFGQQYQPGFADQPASWWIADECYDTRANGNLGPYSYEFETSFSVNSLPNGKVLKIRGRFAADDNLSDVRLNGARIMEDVTIDPEADQGSTIYNFQKDFEFAVTSAGAQKLQIAVTEQPTYDNWVGLNMQFDCAYYDDPAPAPFEPGSDVFPPTVIVPPNLDDEPENPPDPPCLQDGGICQNDGQCCSKSCLNIDADETDDKLCVPPIPVPEITVIPPIIIAPTNGSFPITPIVNYCKAPGNSCSSNGDCCSGLCLGNTCMTKEIVIPPTQTGFTAPSAGCGCPVKISCSESADCGATGLTTPNADGSISICLTDLGKPQNGLLGLAMHELQHAKDICAGEVLDSIPQCHKLETNAYNVEFGIQEGFGAFTQNFSPLKPITKNQAIDMGIKLSCGEFSDDPENLFPAYIKAGSYSYQSCDDVMNSPEVQQMIAQISECAPPIDIPTTPTPPDNTQDEISGSCEIEVIGKKELISRQIPALAAICTTRRRNECESQNKKFKQSECQQFYTETFGTNFTAVKSTCLWSCSP